MREKDLALRSFQLSKQNWWVQCQNPINCSLVYAFKGMLKIDFLILAKRSFKNFWRDFHEKRNCGFRTALLYKWFKEPELLSYHKKKKFRRERGDLITEYRQIHWEKITNIKEIFKMDKKAMHKLTVWKLMPDKLETRSNLLQQGWLTIRTSHFWKQRILFFCSNSERIFSWQRSLFHKIMVLYTAVIDESISSLLQQFGLDVSSGLHICLSLERSKKYLT